MTRVPRPFIWSKYTRLRTSRRNSRHSRGLMSVPVEIMSTVTATRGLYSLRNLRIRVSAFSSEP